MATINSKMTALADAIRAKTSRTDTLTLDEMTASVESIETGSGGEDVTTETNAYTTKLASLETAISALETELEGKASGGSGITIDTCTVNITYSHSDWEEIDLQGTFWNVSENQLYFIITLHQSCNTTIEAASGSIILLNGVSYYRVSSNNFNEIYSYGDDAMVIDLYGVEPGAIINITISA